MGFQVTGCPAGEGVIDIPLLLKELAAYPKFYSITLEIWSDPFEELDLTITREHRWVAKSMSYLEQVMLPYR